MKDDLFEEMEVTFLDATIERKRQVKQGYYDYLAELLKSGEGLLPNLLDPEELIQRKITAEEEEEILYKIGLFLQSLN